jgi:hypothetical protein
MTDASRIPERADLRPLAPDDVERERVVGAVMSRLAGRPQLAPQPPAALLESVTFVRPGWVATAAAAIIVLSAAVALVDRDPPPSPESVIVSWADRQYVPTNGELLTAFLGYTP